MQRKPLSVTTTHFFALWLIPRLTGFTKMQPGIDVRITAETRVQDLERDGLDVAIRHGPAMLAGPNAADMRHHVMLQYDDPDARHPWPHWKTWLADQQKRAA